MIAYYFNMPFYQGSSNADVPNTIAERTKVAPEHEQMQEFHQSVESLSDPTKPLGVHQETRGPSSKVRAQVYRQLGRLAEMTGRHENILQPAKSNTSGTSDGGKFGLVNIEVRARDENDATHREPVHVHNEVWMHQEVKATSQEVMVGDHTLRRYGGDLIAPQPDAREKTPDLATVEIKSKLDKKGRRASSNADAASFGPEYMLKMAPLGSSITLEGYDGRDMRRTGHAAMHAVHEVDQGQHVDSPKALQKPWPDNSMYSPVSSTVTASTQLESNSSLFERSLPFPPHLQFLLHV